MNDFSGSHISPKFGGLSNLTHLNLSDSRFTGQVPSEISYLSKLHSLHMDGDSGLTLASDNFKLLLKNMTKLRELELRSVSISSTIPSNFSSFLKTLRLPDTQLYGILPDRVFHLPNLQYLELSQNNQLEVRFPMTKWNCSASLKGLYLSGVNFTKVLKPISDLFGPIGLFNQNWTQLEALELSSNFLTGPISFNVSGLQKLQLLVLSSNKLNGTIPPWISSLPSLTYLDLNDNHFSGRIAEFKSKKLLWIDLGKNHLQSPLPNTLLNQNDLLFLNLSSNCFNGNLDFSMFSNLSGLSTLDLSYNSYSSWTNDNQVMSNLPEIYDLDLRSNLLQGSVPIPPISIQHFFMSRNNLTGETPLSICNLKSLTILDLASNSLKGEIPTCLGNLSVVEVLDMRHNNLSGTIQTSISVGIPLRTFNFHGNKLEGQIPRSLINCKQLEVLDLGNNELNDTFPMWLGTIPSLKVLSLRSNKLHGPIRTARAKTSFPQLQIIDLSYNGFNGALPAYVFEKLHAMKKDEENVNAYIGDYYYRDSITIAEKGLSTETFQISAHITIDLSSNRFEGYIPSVIGDLTSLRVLNLSHNSLEGHIPTSLGSLPVIESLDLSFNKLDGRIPKELASITSLAFLSLSHNHLVGCIPSGNQFATFQSSSYEGNDGLQGYPLSKDCGDDRVPRGTTPPSLDQEEDSHFFIEMSWEAIWMGYGCGLVIGIFVVLSTQNPTWLSRMIEEHGHRISMRKKRSTLASKA